MAGCHSYPSSLRPKAGFTVAEVLMVILILAGILGLVIVNFFSFEGAFSKRPALDLARLAVNEAHLLARTHRTEVHLLYDKEGERFVINTAGGAPLTSFQLNPGSNVEIKFFRILPETQFESEPTFETEEHTIDHIRFFAYGATAPFVIEVETATVATTLRFDAFSALNWPTSDAL